MNLAPYRKAIAAAVAGAALGGGAPGVFMPPEVAATMPWYGYLASALVGALVTALPVYAARNDPLPPGPA